MIAPHAGETLACPKCRTGVTVPAVESEGVATAVEETCAECQAEIMADEKFCPECGAAVGTEYPKCKSWNNPGKKFCASCGLSTTRAEVFDGFGQLNYHTIPYAQIDGVQAKQGWYFEKRAGVGDIYVNTLTEGTLILEEVPNFQKNFKRISKIMSEFSAIGGGQAIHFRSNGGPAGFAALRGRRRIR